MNYASLVRSQSDLHLRCVVVLHAMATSRASHRTNPAATTVAQRSHVRDCRQTSPLHDVAQMRQMG
jgi:hypothetical protein